MTRSPGAIAVLAVAAVSLIVAAGEPDYALADGAALALELAAGVALGAAGATLADRRAGRLLQAGAAAWLAAEWASPGAGALVFTLGLVATPMAPAFIAHALLGRARALVACTYAALGLVAAATLFTDPRAHGCASCPANLLSINDAPAAAAALERWGLRLAAVALAAAVVLLGRRAWRASAAARRTMLPVLAPGALFLVFVVAGQVQALQRSWDAADATLRVAQGLALLGLAAGVAWQRLSARRMRSRLARLVVELAGTARPGGLRDLLADVLHDSSLELLYAFEDGWIDWEGMQRTLPADRQVTSLVRGGEETAVVVHGPGPLERIGELEPALRLAIDHQRLEAQQRAQLARLRASRAAIVAAADAERRRLERDLHDGAQQALAALAMAIGLARAADGDRSLARAQDRVRAALAGVRALAHATYPAALDDAGLAAALEVLSEWRPDVEFGAVPDTRLDPALEAGVYFIVVALTAQAATVDVRVEDELIIEVRTAAGDLTDVEDRVGALGGRLSVDDGRVSVRLACA